MKEPITLEQMSAKLNHLYAKYEDQYAEHDITRDDLKSIESMLREVATELEIPIHF